MNMRDNKVGLTAMIVVSILGGFWKFGRTPGGGLRAGILNRSVPCNISMMLSGGVLSRVDKESEENEI